MTGTATRRLPGLDDVVVVTRDDHGIPHVQARTEHDAWFGLGYAAAEDRLWQLEYDRRRACGRWAEAAGPAGLPADRLARRLDVAAAARADVDAMDQATRASFTAYAAGVNARADAGDLPPEYEACGIGWEPWQPWHSVAAFKIRHVLMGIWQYKLARAVVLASDGVDAFEWLGTGPLPGMRVTVPAGGRLRLPADSLLAMLDDARADIAAAAEHLGFLGEVEAGSNAWAVAGSRTATGAPVLCNDSHRALDVPNVYWQAHVSCPDFTVSVDELAGYQGDVTSVAAQRWGGVLAGRGPYDGDAEAARLLLAGFDGRLAVDSPAALLYACFRRCLAELLLGERLCPATVSFLLRGPVPAAAVLARRWFARLVWPPEPGAPLPVDDVGDDVLAGALARAWRDAGDLAGPDPGAWRWGEHHGVDGTHTVAELRDTYAGLLRAGLGCDNETIQNASYPWPRGEPFVVTNCAVYRQVLDLADLTRSRWVLPGGASGDLRSAHATDQLRDWQRHRHLPMAPTTAGTACRILELRPTDTGGRREGQR